MSNQSEMIYEGAPSLHGARNVEDVLRRTGGQDLLSWMRALGFWVESKTSKHTNAEKPRAFTHTTTGGQLSDMLAYWSSEYARSAEILGVLQGERIRLKVEVDRVHAQVSLRLLEELKETETKSPTQKILEMHVLQDTTYREHQDRMVVIDTAIKAMSGAKEGSQGIRDGISREITRRGDLARGRLD